MTSPVWITNSGFLGTITERTAVNVAFTVSGTATSFSVISGSLPSGLVLKQETTATSTSTTCFIVGNATSVPTTLSSQFVVRATNNSGLADRTFVIDVEGGIDPTWITPAGYLAVGTSGEYFAVNKQIVDYQLTATPSVLFENMKLRYYIADNDGQLPKGLSLTEDGRIVGIIDEITVAEASYSVTDASYDTIKYDVFGYDGSYYVETISAKPKFILKK